jgi:YesN/AraC family two-component response regulator
LVDDEPIILRSLARDLSKNSTDLDVTLEVSGERAIIGINKISFDLVVTDLVMPGLDGLAVLKAANGQGRIARVKHCRSSLSVRRSTMPQRTVK